MEVKQIYELVNNATSEILGEESSLLAEDLSNLVDIGTEIFNANAMDRYVRSLVNHIGKVIFVNRKYSGSAPSVLMDSWEYGSVVEKISGDLPLATENESWELEDGQVYENQTFYKPTVSAKFFNNKVTFEIPCSFTELQVKQSFSNATQLNAFISMLYNEIDKAMTVKVDALVMRTINNFIAETAHAEYGTAQFSSKSTVKAVNLLYLYNTKFSKSLTAAASITDPDFIRFASFVLRNYAKRMSKISRLFNIGEKARFTPRDFLKIVMHSEFESAASVYLYSDTFHNELLTLPSADSVPYWQGTGDDFDFADTSKINVKDSSGDSVELGGVLAVMFDRDALGVTNLDRRVTTSYNAKGEFYNNFYKFDAGYFNDFNENFVVFFVA